MSAQQKLAREERKLPKLNERLQALQMKINRILAMQIADVILQQFEQHEDIEAIKITAGEEEYDNGWFIVVCETLGTMGGVEDVNLEFEDQFYDKNLNDWRDEFLDGLEIDRRTVKRLKFDREEVAKALSLIP